MIASENFRDLGGLPLRDDGVTRSGVLWRSGHLDGLDAAAWADVRALGIATIWGRERWPQSWSAVL